MGIARYRRLVDLYVTGKEFVLADGSPLWLQVLNPFERETVRKEAQIARARMVLAMKEVGSDEQVRVKAAFYADGRDIVVAQLVDGELTSALPRLVDSIRNDPDWTERLEVLERGDDDVETKPEEDELLGKLQADYLAEIGNRAETEKQFLTEKFQALDEDALWQAYLDSWLQKLGDEMAMLTFRSGQISYAARACDATKTEDGWDHSECAGHPERIWKTVAEIRSLPVDLQNDLLDGLDEIEFTERQAKNSARQMSSSGSSQLPSEVEASTPSTQTETHDVPPGTSSPQSPTP